MKYNEALVISEDIISRMVNIHENNGYIIITAQSDQHTEEQNKKFQKELIQKIKNSGYSYKAKGISGGSLEYDDKNKDGSQKYKKIDGEKSIIVFNYKTNGEKGDINELKKLGMKWAKDYHQHSFYFKHPNNQPLWINPDGTPNTSFHKQLKINDNSEQFYTNLNGFKTGVSPKNGKMPKSDKRFATSMNKINKNGKWKEPEW